MTNNGNSGNLIHLLAAYRPVQFPQAWPGSRKLKEIAETIDNNCTATIRFANSKLRAMHVDGEELFSIAALREEALALQKACRVLHSTALKADSSDTPRSFNAKHVRRGFSATPNHRRLPAVDYSLVTLRSQYDTFVNWVRHFFFLLDRDLAGRIDGAL